MKTILKLTSDEAQAYQKDELEPLRLDIFPDSNILVAFLVRLGADITKVKAGIDLAEDLTSTNQADIEAARARLPSLLGEAIEAEGPVTWLVYGVEIPSTAYTAIRKLVEMVDSDYLTVAVVDAKMTQQ